ncbi:MAG: class I adenylate-forming enzyme family protein [Sporichthyaceae bacterium]
MATSLVSTLRWWARTKGDDTALIVGEDAVTFRGLHDWSGRVGRDLAERGVRPGDRVCVLGGNSLPWCAAALGVLRAGGVLVPMNARMVPSELHGVVRDAGATVLVHADELAASAAAVNELGADLHLVPFAAVEQLRAGGEDDFVVDTAPDDTIMVLFTSGSTGLSKGVVCTNRSVLNIAFEASLTEEGLRPGGRTLLVLPLAFTPGLVWGLSISAVIGGLLVIEPEFVPARAVDLIERHRIGAIFGVPLIFGAMAAAENFAAADLSSLRTALTGGAAVPVPLLEAWSAKGVSLRQIYGMTEAGGVATGTLVRDADLHPDSCGTGSIFTEFKVVRSDGTECDADEPGEILLRGPGMTPGYWNDPETTAAAIVEGWLRSGDLGVADKDGRLRFVDRLKDLIITGGINVSPVEIEMTIGAMEGIAEVAVVSAPDERFGETPAAIVVGKPGVDLDLAAIVEHCNTHLTDYKVPRYVVVRTTPLPRLPSGKLAKPAIRAEYRDVATTHPRVR